MQLSRYAQPTVKDRGTRPERTVGQGSQGPGESADLRVAELRSAVAELQKQLAQYPVEFVDRGIAEQELAALREMADSDSPALPRLRRSLLLVAGSVGSVRALAPALAEVRFAVELLAGRPGH